MNSITIEWLKRMMIDDIDSLTQKQKNFLVGVCYIEHDKHNISHKDMKIIIEDLRTGENMTDKYVNKCEICEKLIYDEEYEIITDESDGSKHCICNDCLKDDN